MTDGDDLSVAMSSATVNDSEMWWRMLRRNEKWNSVPPSDWIERKSLFTSTNSSSGYCFNSQSTRNFLFLHSHNDLPWNIRKFLKNQLREFRFGENLKEIAPWSTSSWSHTDLRRLKEGMVAAQVICEQIIPSFEKKWKQNWNVTFVVAVADGFMRAITGSRGKKWNAIYFPVVGKLPRSSRSNIDINAWASPKTIHCNVVILFLRPCRRRLFLEQFWSAYAPCSSQHLDAVQLTVEQIDLIRRIVRLYPQHMSFVTSAEGSYGCQWNYDLNSWNICQPGAA